MLQDSGDGEEKKKKKKVSYFLPMTEPRALSKILWGKAIVLFSIFSEVLGATRPQVDSENGEENLTQLYTKALQDLDKTQLRG